ncbi:helix-turn-helix transcriptional regulator [Microbispora sp. NPDC088329]|uniref:helix-turn-helix domain-containing protein n=1 Tax=Microbispora sp. NPDC088329 TaxID=3154869 RepID=UPI003430705B
MKLHRLVDALIARRRALDLSQAEAARLAGINAGTVSQWEGGLKEPRLSVLCTHAGGMALLPAVVNPRTRQTLASGYHQLVPAVVAFREQEGVAAAEIGRRMGVSTSAVRLIEGGRPMRLLSGDRYVTVAGLLLTWVYDRPRCCRCDPFWCRTDESGEHCAERSCGRCLHGCPAPDGVTCCEAAVPARVGS